MLSGDFSDPPSSPPVLVAVTPYPEDARFLHALCAEVHSTLRTVPTLAEAYHREELHTAGVVVCERDLPDGTWKDLLAYLRAQAPGARLVVTSLHADECLWAEVLNLGGYDVLAKPFDRREVQRVLSLALRKMMVYAA